MFKRVYIWSTFVRIWHWLRAVSGLVLMITGIYIGRPIIDYYDIKHLYAMSLIRVIHFSAGFVFTFGFIVRLWWFFRGTRFEHWRAWLPINRTRWKNFFQIAKYYLFLENVRPPYLGVNPIAGISYIIITLLFFLQILTGFALFVLPYTSGFWHAAFGWINVLFQAQYVRLWHHILMWVFVAFFIVHIYLSALSDIEEKSGTTVSIINGVKYQRVIDTEQISMD
jgi:Ni/Fe-hydrogenase 1 B-type cytochrome subunit